MSLFDTIREQLAVEAPTLAISQRRRLWKNVSAAIPATSWADFSINLTLPDTLGPDDGLLLEQLYGLIVPSTSGSNFYTITDLSLTLADQLDTVMGLATPVVTTLAPRQIMSLLFEPPPLLLARDIDTIARLQFGSTHSIFIPGVQPLITTFNVGIANSDAAGHIVVVSLALTYRYIQGLREG
jgi:hypothetical protein